jgi:hypothetical protein
MVIKIIFNLKKQFTLENLEHIYGATKAQLPRKIDGAQSFINKTIISLKEIGSWA